MKKWMEDKRVLWIMAGITLLVFVYLAAGLGSLQLQPDRPFWTANESSSQGDGEGASLLVYWAYFIVGMLALFLLLLFLLLDKDQRKKFLFGLLRLAVLGFIVFLVFSGMNSGDSVQLPLPGGATPLFTPGPDEPEPTPFLVPASVYEAPRVSGWVSYLATLAFLMAGVAGWWWWMRRRKVGQFLRDELADAAQSALDDIQAGKDWGNAVMNCYARMSQVVAVRRGFKRPLTRTPSEFAAELERARLPRDAVQKLTTLFERTRYGAKTSTRKDIDEAVACMGEIVAACQETQ